MLVFTVSSISMGSRFWYLLWFQQGFEALVPARSGWYCASPAPLGERQNVGIYNGFGKEKRGQEGGGKREGGRREGGGRGAHMKGVKVGRSASITLEM